MAITRIINLPNAEDPSNDDFVMLDGNTGGARKLSADTFAKVSALGTAAARNVGIGAGEVAAGDDGRIGYDTVASASALNIPEQFGWVRTAGKDDVGDGGGGLWRRVEVRPYYAREWQSADGSWWEPVGARVAKVLWTGQSNAEQPYCNSSLHPDGTVAADTISTYARIWSTADGAWVTLQAGKSRIAAGAQNHSLFNFTRLLIDEGGYDRIDVVMSTMYGRPIADWVGTPADRTLSIGNRPRMQDIVDQAAAAGVSAFSHIATVQGEANSLTDMFPWSVPGTYGYEREFLRRDLVDRGLADKNTRWLEGELLQREIAGTSWQANTVIARLDQVGRDNVAVVSTEGFVGQDEGLTFDFQGLTVPYRLHFSAADNSEYGRRMARAVISLENGKARKVSDLDVASPTPFGVNGTVHPFESYTNQTVTLSSIWARDGYIKISGACDITLLADDLRLGQKLFAGRRITFALASGALLNLTTVGPQIYGHINGGGLSNRLSRRNSSVGGKIVLEFDGSQWVLIEDITHLGTGSGITWKCAAGRLDGSGTVTVTGLSAGDEATFTFPANFPLLANSNYVIVCDSGCRVTTKTVSGFTVRRLATSTTTAVAFALFNGQPENRDTDADAYIRAACRDAPSAALDAYEAFISGLKSDGLWPLIEHLYVMAAPTQAAALIDLKNPSAAAAVASGTLTHTPYVGMQGDGSTGKIDTGLNLSTRSLMLIGNAHVMVDTLSDADSVAADIGGDITNSTVQIAPRTSGNWLARIGSGSSTTRAVSTSVGFHVATRNGASMVTTYVDGVGASETRASSSFSNVNLLLLSSGSGRSPRQISMGSVGACLTAAQVAAYKARVATFKAAMAALA